MQPNLSKTRTSGEHVNFKNDVMAFFKVEN